MHDENDITNRPQALRHLTTLLIYRNTVSVWVRSQFEVKDGDKYDQAEPLSSSRS